MDEVVDVDHLIDALIDREGGFAEHPADKGGPTCLGITQAVARAHGYAGPMRQLPPAIAERLRLRPQAAANSSPRGTASMSGLSAAAGGPTQTAVQDGLPSQDALTATEQAIQLDELIKWVRRQAAVDNNPAAVASPPRD